MTLIEAAKLAREALEEINKLSIGEHAICLPAEIDTAMDALDQAIAEAEQQEPVAWESVLGAVARGWCHEENANKTMDSELAVAIAKEVHALYTTPPQRTWQGLTDEEMHECWDSPLTPLGMKHARMIEAKLKEKNT